MKLNYFALTGLLLTAPIFAAPQTIQPASKTETQQFLKLMNHSKIPEYKGMKWNDANKVLTIKSVYSSQVFNLYYADINNNGKKDFILTEVQEGSGNYSNLDAVFSVTGNRLKQIDFKKAIQTGLGLKTTPANCVNWYCYLDKSFLTTDNNLVYLNFMNVPKSKNMTCTYLWKGKNFKLITGGDCIK